MGLGGEPAVQVRIVPGVFFIPRIPVVPKVFYQCLPSLGFLAVPFSKGVSGGPLRSLENYPCAIQ